MSEALIKPGPSGALFGNDRIYRYVLWRRWGAPDLPLSEMVAFIGLNPSTADEETDDPTIRKCRGFAQRWGYDGMVMLNVFPYRATNPSDLKFAVDLFSSDYANLPLWSCATNAGLVVCCWGTHGTLLDGGDILRNILRNILRGAYAELHHLGLTKSGQPKHPLYLPYDTPLTKWEADDA